MDSDDLRVRLERASAIDGVVGFALGGVLWQAALEGWRDGKLSRDAAVAMISDTLLQCLNHYSKAV